MKLLDRSGYRPDDFSRDGAASAIIAPLADLQAPLWTRRDNGPIGVEIANNTDVERLARLFDRLALIAIVFPGLRRRARLFARAPAAAGRLQGRLRAVGPLIPDQGAYAFACGFDEIELPEASVARQTEAQWRAALDAITAPYQPGYASPRRAFSNGARARAQGARMMHDQAAALPRPRLRRT